MSSMATVSLYGFSNFIYLFFGFNRNNLVLHHYVFVDQYVYDYRNCLPDHSFNVGSKYIKTNSMTCQAIKSNVKHKNVFFFYSMRLLLRL